MRTCMRRKRGTSMLMLPVGLHLTLLWSYDERLIAILPSIFEGCTGISWVSCVPHRSVNTNVAAARLKNLILGDKSIHYLHLIYLCHPVSSWWLLEYVWASCVYSATVISPFAVAIVQPVGLFTATLMEMYEYDKKCETFQMNWSFLFKLLNEKFLV